MEKYLHILIEYLKTKSYRIDVQNFKERLFSDPDKGVVAITNTLDFFNVNNVVATVPKEALKELPKSFIAQVSNNSQFNLVLVTKLTDENIKVNVGNKSSIIVGIEEFLKNWTGLIIAIEENENTQSKNLKIQLTNIILVTGVILAVFYVGLSSDSLLKSVFLAFSIVGVYVSYLIVKEKLSVEGSSSKFCKISENTDCQTVLNSKRAKLFNIIDLSDVSIIYFSFLSLAFIIKPNIAFFKIASILSLPIVIYSIYHQYFKIKKWCPLCLVIAGILLLQFFVLQLIPKESTFNFLILLPTLSILVISIISWLNLKKLMFNSLENRRLRIENLTFRRNYHLFLPYFNSLHQIDTSEEIISDITFGNRNADVKIIMITNPLCELCFETHDILMKLLEKYENQIFIRFRFFVPFENRDDPKTQIAERLLELYLNKDKNTFSEAFNHWYSRVSINEWLTKWGICMDKKINSLIKDQVTWCVKNNFNYTPTVLINKKLFPNFYHPKDITNFIKKIIDFHTINKTKT
ncbi:vitamin K epoxide reductase family protein [Winogradskyella sp.]|uniref:vitamin K epoxide reductase family protein n=1 Tax=Winogradskyella sp. TaxID=1883156 RepID=UPI0025F0547E|nr:vitamin K epoxide reductase family protein [Winogradskyella sp.]MBT8245767.1 thioredoxin domain-containing protein [Winogradskyella sp.]